MGLHDEISKLTQSASTSYAKGASRSAVTPLLWQTSIVTPVAFFLASRTQGGLSWFFASVGICPMVMTYVAYLYFMVKRPEYLRSEEFQIKKQSLEILGNKGSVFNENTIDLIAVENPKPIAELPPGDAEQAGKQ